MILVIIDVQKAACDLLTQHRPNPSKGRGAVAEPPLDVAGRVRASVKGIQWALRRNRKGREAHIQASVCTVNGCPTEACTLSSKDIVVRCTSKMSCCMHCLPPSPTTG